MKTLLFRCLICDFCTNGFQTETQNNASNEITSVYTIVYMKSRYKLQIKTEFLQKKIKWKKFTLRMFNMNGHQHNLFLAISQTINDINMALNVN